MTASERRWWRIPEARMKPLTLLLRRSGVVLATMTATALGFAFPPSAGAQGVSKVGTTAADFLQIGVGARATAMGGAFVAVSDDAASLYWNPAGLAQIAGSEVIAAHSEWLADVNFDYVGFTMSLGNAGNIGVSVTMLAMPEMLVRTEDRQEGTGETFDASDLAVGVSYGRAVTDRFNVGATVKFVQQRIWHSSASGFAVDLGTQFRTDFFGGLTIGAAVFNFGTDLKLDGRDLRIFVDPDPLQLGNNSRIPANYELESFDLPLNFQFGVTSRPINSRMHRLTLSADALHPSSNYESVNVGFEYGYQGRVFLRGGFQSLLLDENEGGVAGGVGVHQQLFGGSFAKLDYAYRAVGRLGGIHVIGLGLTF